MTRTTSETTTQAIHLQAILKDYGEAQNALTVVYSDSKHAHDSLLSKNFSKRLNRVPTARQCVREQLESCTIEVKHVRTHQQRADFFTKHCSRIFQELL